MANRGKAIRSYAKENLEVPLYEDLPLVNRKMDKRRRVKLVIHGDPEKVYTIILWVIGNHHP